MGKSTEETALASATADPDTPAIITFTTIATKANPPLKRPTKYSANSANFLVIPASFISAPASIKKGIDTKDIESIPETRWEAKIFKENSPLIKI